MLGPGRKPARSEKRINGVLTAVRGMVAHAVTHKDAPQWVLPVLFDLAASEDLPAAARDEGAGAGVRLGVRHRMKEPKRPVDRASDEEILGLLRACRTARDRMMLLFMGRGGLRRGELVGAPMPPRAVNELLTALSKRAGLSRRVRPHQLRHAFASNARAAGAEWDEVSEVMGHESPESLLPYMHLDPQVLRDAVERVPSPRLLGTDGEGRK